MKQSGQIIFTVTLRTYLLQVSLSLHFLASAKFDSIIQIKPFFTLTHAHTLLCPIEVYSFNNASGDIVD